MGRQIQIMQSENLPTQRLMAFFCINVAPVVDIVIVLVVVVVENDQVEAEAVVGCSRRIVRAVALEEDSMDQVGHRSLERMEVAEEVHHNQIGQEAVEHHKPYSVAVVVVGIVVAVVRRIPSPAVADSVVRAVVGMVDEVAAVVAVVLLPDMLAMDGVAYVRVVAAVVAC